MRQEHDCAVNLNRELPKHPDELPNLAAFYFIASVQVGCRIEHNETRSERPRFGLS